MMVVAARIDVVLFSFCLSSFQLFSSTAALLEEQSFFSFFPRSSLSTQHVNRHSTCSLSFFFFFCWLYTWFTSAACK